MAHPIKVRLETIRYGKWHELQIAIALKDTKALYVTYPTAEIILNYRRDSLREKIASKSLKAFLSKDLIAGKILGDIVNKSKGDGTSRVALILFDDFVSVMVWEAAVNQNIAIAQVLATGFADSFRSIAYEQIGEGLDLEERQEYIETRLEGIVVRNGCTDAIQNQYLETHPDCDRVPFYAFTNPSDALNRLLTGHSAKYWRERFGVTTDDALRGVWGHPHLRRIANIEELASTYIERDRMTPVEAVKKAVAEFGYIVWGEDKLVGKGDRKTYLRNHKRKAPKF